MNFHNWFTYILQPLCIPCYLFLLTVPTRYRTIRQTGHPGRPQQTKADEIAKRLVMALLILMSVGQLFSS